MRGFHKEGESEGIVTETQKGYWNAGEGGRD